MVGEQMYTVQAITAFFVTGTSFSGVHLCLPNSAVLSSGQPLTNYTANGTLQLELKVSVRAGRKSCASVRTAMDAAAAAFDARLVAALEKAVPDARAVASALPPCKVQGPCAITNNGVQWMLKPLVPELAWLDCVDLGTECIHDCLMEAGVEIFEVLHKRSP